MQPTTPPIDSLDRRFLLVTGKGGVGKSTASALLALRSSRLGRRTLVCELNAKERIAPMFGRAPVGSVVTEVVPNLWCVNIEPSAAMEEYALMKLRFRTLYRLVFDNPLVQSLVRFVPGMNDLLMLGKAFNHERERDAEGQPVWDQVIVDAPATGHGITFFRLPKVIRDAVPAGNMHREAAEMWGLLIDPTRTAVHLVCLPEELPVQETRELHHRLKDELGMPLGRLFMNMMPPPLLDSEQAADFARLTVPPDDPQLSLLWETTRIRLAREALAADYADGLQDLGLPVVRLPQQYTYRFGFPELVALLEPLNAQVRSE